MNFGGWIYATGVLVIVAGPVAAVDMKVDADYKAAKSALEGKSGAELAKGLESLASKEARQHDEAENYSGAEAWALANAAYEWMKLGLAAENEKRQADATANFEKAATDYTRALACKKIQPDCKEIVDRNVERLAKRGVTVGGQDEEDASDQQK